MKHFIYITTLYIFLHSPYEINAQSTVDSTSVIGFWNLDFNETYKESDILNQGQFDMLDSHIKSKVRESLSNRTYEFYENHQLKAYWIFNGKQMKFEGSWQIINKNVLQVQLDDEILLYELFVRNRNKIILKKKNDSVSQFNNLVLKRKQS